MTRRDANSLTHLERSRLATKLRAEGQPAKAVRQPSPQPTNRAAKRAPLSFGQLGVWMRETDHSQSAYNALYGFELLGALNLARIVKSIGAVFDRHDILRTCFVCDQGEAEQCVDDRIALPVICVDVLPASLSKQLQDHLITAFAEEEIRRPFRIEKGQVIRVLLIRISNERAVCIIACHHLVTDYWSGQIFFHDLAELYGSPSTAPNETLTPLPIQYADYSIWERERFEGPARQRCLAHWRRHLADVPSTISLPYDWARPKAPASPAGVIEFSISSERWLQLLSFGRENKTTLFPLLLVAWGIVLSRSSREQLLSVGTVAANRQFKTAEELIGFFANVLPVRIDLTGNPTLLEIMGRVKRSAFDAFAFQDIPLSLLIEELAPERTEGTVPYIPAVLILQNTPAPQRNFSDIQIRPLALSLPTPPKFDLNLVISAQADHGKGRLEFDKDIFEGATVQSLLDQFLVVLERLVVAPQTHLSDLSLMSDEAPNQQSARPVSEHCVSPTITQLFEHFAATTPEAVAVIDKSLIVTYSSLNARANELAHYLISIGIRPEECVGVCTDRGVSLIIAILAILKAGAAYLPLDPQYPDKRLQFLLADTSVRVVLSQGSYSHRFSSFTCIEMEQNLGASAKFPTQDPPPRVNSQALAYVIYTSGSTGLPKGVMIPHGNVTELLHSVREHICFGPGDVWTMFHSFAFDFSVWEIFGALCSGGTVALVAKDEAQDPRALHSLLKETKTTIFSQTPSAFREFVHYQQGVPHLRLDDLRFVVFGGEALDWPSVKSWWQIYRPGSPELINMYGITETTVHVTFQRLGTDLRQNSPIGRPLAHLQLFALDEFLNMVPARMPGELCVGGSGLARGYHKRPDLTAEKFIPNPWGPPGSRLYRSGDIGRPSDDGSFSYVGRFDSQVKFRGYRIELSEIENVIRLIPGIGDAAVLLTQSNNGEPRIVAYCVTELHPEFIIHTLRRDLPPHLIPSRMVIVASLPRTNNGKLDRATLGGLGDSITTALTPLTTPIHHALAEIFQESLGVAAVDPQLSLFTLGGHSLTAARIATRIRNQFALNIGVGTIFKNPSIYDLSAWIQTELESVAHREHPKIAKWGGSVYPATASQEALWFLHQLEDRNDAYIVAGEVRINGPLSLLAVRDTIAKLIQRHSIFNSAFYVRDDGELFLRSMPNTVHSLNVYDLTELSETTHSDMLKVVSDREVAKSFNLVLPPLLRTSAIRYSATRHSLLMVLHHSITDEWSLRNLQGEFIEIYASLTNGTEPKLPDIRSTFEDYAAWEHSYLRSPEAQQRVNSIARSLSGLRPLSLPYDRQHVVRGRARSCDHIYAGIPFEEIERACQASGVTLFMFALAAWLVTLSRITTDRDISVAVPVANRQHPHIEFTQGLFVNTVIVRGRLRSNMTLHDALQYAKELIIGTSANEDIPLPSVVAALSGDADDRDRLSMAQTMLTINEVSQQNVSHEGITFEINPIQTTDVKSDLLLTVLYTTAQSRLQLTYDDNLFHEKTASSLLNTVMSVIDQMVHSPGTLLDQVNLIPPDERQRLLSTSVRVEETSMEESVAHAFARVAAERENEPAIQFDGGEISYSALDSVSTQFAAQLAAKGVRPGDFVAVLYHRSPQIIIIFLSILKLGAAYVPIEPDQPHDRIAYIIEDCRPTAVVVEPHVTGQIGAAIPPELLLIPQLENAQAPRQQTADLFTHALHPQQLAYVMYTSGTTGWPKGVCISHRNILRLVRDQEFIRFTSETKILQLASVAFDAATFEIWGPLLNGGTVIVSPAEQLSILHLGRLLYTFKPTAAFLTSSLFTLATEEIISALGVFKDLVVGGEAVDLIAAKEMLRTNPHTRLVNGYGPTETTTFALFRNITLEDCAAPTIPIGQPINRTTAIVLGPDYQLLPIGAIGEIYIGGDGVGTGYLGKPDLTAEFFLPSEFGEPSERLYRTGDLGRYRYDSSIGYLGRIDDQLKIRGFRIELGEVEASMRRIPGVTGAAVLPTDHAPHGKRLRAYIATELSRSQLARSMQKALPHYMIPSQFCIVGQLPLTKNGKIDKRALWDQFPVQDDSSYAFELPKTDLQRDLIEIWKTVLKTDRELGVNENFFDIGGHSLLVAKLQSLILRRFEVEIPLVALYENPTISDITRYLSGEDNTTGGDDLEARAQRIRGAYRHARTIGGRRANV